MPTTLPSRDLAPSDPELRAAFLRALTLAERFTEMTWTLADLRGLEAETVAAATRRAPEGWGAKLGAYARETLRSAQASGDEQGREAVEVNEAWRRLAKATTWERVVETSIVENVRWCGRNRRGIAECAKRLRDLLPKEAARIQRDALQQALSAVGTNSFWEFIAQVVAQATPSVLREHKGEGEARLDNLAHAIDRRHRPDRMVRPEGTPRQRRRPKRTHVR